MPELPEVETIVRQLAPFLENRRIREVEVLDPRWCAPLTPSELQDAVTGRRVKEMSRRGKYIVWGLDGDLHLIQHLRMSGAILWNPEQEPAHVRVRMTLAGRRGRGREDVARLLVVDQRRFGTAQLLFGDEAVEQFFADRLGYEPFDEDFTSGCLWKLTRRRTAPVKAFILDQRMIAGVGNIYADEALFRAGIDPRMPAGSLTKAQCGRLREGIIDALSEGIDAKGASIADFKHIDGLGGSFQDRFLVHRRAGEPCPKCGGEVVRVRVAGRATYVCPRCQRRSAAGGASRQPDP